MASAGFAPITHTKRIELKAIPSGQGLEFVEAELFLRPEIPFAIIFYSDNGIRQEDGMRMDLDKQIFLDHFEDQAREDTATAAAPVILDQIFDFFETHPPL